MDDICLNATTDTRSWRWDPNGTFSIQSYYKGFQKTLGNIFPYTKVRNFKFSPKVAFVVWLIHHSVFLTQDNLAKRGWAWVNRCIFCKNEVETINHLFMHCSIIVQLGEAALFLLGF